MKNSPLTTVLLGVLALSALASVVMCWMYIGSTRELRTLRDQMVQITNNRNVINSLLNDTLEYSKRNPAIVPVLESVGWKMNTPAPAAPVKSSTK